MVAFFLGFFVAAACGGLAIWAAATRVARHLRQNPSGVAAISEHIIMPVLGKQQEEETP